MNLDDFEEYITPTITLRRGLGYYQDSCVLSLKETTANHYKAIVEGSQDYEVSITLTREREVTDSSCTCPYDWGEYCKHQVAVLYALRHRLDSVEHEMIERPAQIDLRSLLESVSKEALVEFLEAYANKSPDLVSSLIAAFPTSDEDFNLTNLGIQFREACCHGIESNSYGTDYSWEEEDDEDIFWAFTSTFKKKIEEYQETIRVAFMVGRIRYGGSIASMMVHELSFLDCTLDHIEDDVTSTVSQIVDLFAEAIPTLDDAHYLFSLFFAEAQNYGIGPQTLLLKLCIRLAEAQSDQEALRSYLIALASDKAASDEYIFDDTIRTSIELQHALLLKQQKLDEAQALALENLEYDSLRKLAYDRAMAIEDYVLAETLILGKERPRRYVHGDPDWGELLFRVYLKSGNTEKKRSLAKEFLLGGDLAYYRILKDSYTEKEWEAVVASLLDEMQNTTRKSWAYVGDPYPEVLKAEGELQRLLAYVQKNLFQVRSYRDVLLAYDKDALFVLYKQIILKEGEEVTDRNGYSALASLFEELVALGGVNTAKECILALEPRYRKRPAMKDELRKVGLL